jgi:N-methylhydantoinase B
MCSTQPGSVGIYGGYPGATNQVVIKRDSNVWQLVAAGELPQDLERLAGEMEVVRGFVNTALRKGDVYQITVTGGGGFGDPLDRDPALVARDVHNGLLSREAALRQYGVVLEARTGLPNAAETAAQRAGILAERGERPAGTADGRADAGQAGESTLAWSLVDTPAGRVMRCRCGFVLGKAGESYKAQAVKREFPLQHAGPLVDPYGVGGDLFVAREFACPGCLTLLDVEVQLRDAPPLQEYLTARQGA